MNEKTRQEDTEPLEQAVGHTFTDKQLLAQALTHRSFSNENNGAPHNERLEFLGDAILQFATTVKLYRLFPDEPEGALSVYRSLVVKTDFLMRVAERLKLREHLRVSEGQKKEMQNSATPVLADAVEALIGAVYLDGGLESAEKCVETHILMNVEEYLAETPFRDPKSELQEYAQREMQITPEYEVLSEDGPDHEKVFTVGVTVGGETIAKATGKSKQDGAQKAAQQALEVYKKQNEETA